MQQVNLLLRRSGSPCKQNDQRLNRWLYIARGELTTQPEVKVVEVLFTAILSLSVSKFVRKLPVVPMHHGPSKN